MNHTQHPPADDLIMAKLERIERKPELELPESRDLLSLVGHGDPLGPHCLVLSLPKYSLNS